MSQCHILIFVRLFRSRRPELFCKKSALKYFRKINSKTPVPESILRLRHRCFPMNFVKV